jgi:hypothetical protein
MKKLFYDMPHHLFNSFFECPDTEMNWHPSTFTLSPPSIKLPFPPPITAQDIVLKRPNSKICSKSPNAFFCYRKAYFDQLALLNQRFKMTDVSKLVSINWKNECIEVKEAYKKLAKEVEWELNERRKRDLVYPEINKITRRKSISKKKCGKLMTTTTTTTTTTNNSNESAMNKQCSTQFELTFGTDMQPLIHSYNGEFENYLMTNCTLDDSVSSSSDEPIITSETNDNNDNDNNDLLFDSEIILDRNEIIINEDNTAINENNDNDDNNDNVFDPIPAQSQNNQQSFVENNGILNNQNVAFYEFCFDDNTNLSWYLQNFV